MSSFTTFDKVNVPTFNNEDHQGEEDDDTSSDYNHHLPEIPVVLDQMSKTSSYIVIHPTEDSA